MAAEHIALLPGMLCDERLWGPQLGAFNVPSSVADFQTQTSIAAMAATVLQTAPARFAVAGLSMGGIVAFEVWRQAPERISHMALLDTNPYPEAPERRALRLRDIETVLTDGLRELAVESMKPAYLAAANRHDDALLGLVLDMALDLGADVFQRQALALTQRVDSVPTLATINCPVHVICGAEDTLCPVDYHTTMAEAIPNAGLTVLDGCGHLSTLEKPREVTAALNALFAH
ncbi:MAG: alpha/beta hydrolase [Pseudomonadota bacterium]